jgi:hypothetical protein
MSINEITKINASLPLHNEIIMILNIYTCDYYTLTHILRHAIIENKLSLVINISKILMKEKIRQFLKTTNVCTNEKCKLFKQKIKERSLFIYNPFDLAAIHGHLEIFKYFYRTNIYKIYPIMIMSTVNYGNVNILKFIYEKETKMIRWFDGRLLYRAIKLNHFSIVEFLINLGVPIDCRAIQAAIQNDSYDCVKILIKNSAPIYNYVVDMAIKKRSYKIAKYLIKHNAPINKKTLISAISSGDKYIILLFKNYNFCDEDIAIAIKGCKEIETMKFLCGIMINE